MSSVLFVYFYLSCLSIAIAHSHPPCHNADSEETDRKVGEFGKNSGVASERAAVFAEDHMQQQI